MRDSHTALDPSRQSIALDREEIGPGRIFDDGWCMPDVLNGALYGCRRVRHRFAIQHYAPDASRDKL